MNPFNQPKPWEPGDRPGSLPRRSMLSSDDDMDITPMIDITFLLLIFFIVASKMDTGSDVTLPLALNGTAVTMKSSAVLTLIGDNPDFVDVYYGEGNAQRRFNAIDPIVQEELVVGFVEDALHASTPKQQVVVRADKAVKHREVSRILRAIGRVAGARAYVAVLEER